MMELVRARDVAGRPVITLDGDAVAQVKDVVFDPADGRLLRFTLAGRGLLSGPLDSVLPWDGVHAFGPDAVMVPDLEAFREPVPAPGAASRDDGDILGARVLADDGTAVGQVVDVVLDVGAARVVGLEVRPDTSRETLIVPLESPAAATGEQVVLPRRSVECAAGDLAAFPAALHRLVTGRRGS